MFRLVGLFVCFLFVLTQTVWEKQKSMDEGQNKLFCRLLTFPTIFLLSEAQRRNESTNQPLSSQLEEVRSAEAELEVALVSSLEG